MFNIYSFIEKSGADSVLLFKTNGDLVLSENLEFAENFAAMSGSIVNMCSEMLEDLIGGAIKQIMIKSENFLIVGSALPDEHLIFAFTTEFSKLGILLRVMESSSLLPYIN